MIIDNKYLLTLWHGLGWMKKTVVKPKKFTVGSIVCSSEYCAPRYKEHFFANDAFPLGSIQTDKLFDEDFKKDCCKKIKDKYQIPSSSKIIFFAPTFRIGEEHHYYNFGIDIEKLSERLQQEDVYIITKRHHVFDSLMRDKGIDCSGVKDSQNGRFIVDTEFDFNELITVADCFATDYSSGMYYAFVLNLPVFLYAIDVKEYISGANGLEINYPVEVPVPFVGEPSIDKFIDAYKASFSATLTEEYKQYKIDNVGSCDGNVANKILLHIYKNFFSEREIPEEIKLNEEVLEQEKLESQAKLENLGTDNVITTTKTSVKEDSNSTVVDN